VYNGVSVDFEADMSIAAFNAFTDLLLIAIGLLVITNLKLRLHTKIALCVILSLSSLYAPSPAP
jgi:preprotein translocase subunit SecF